MKNYLFDVKLFSSIRVNALDEKTARAMLREALNGASANFGAWPDGAPIVADVSLDDDPADLVEIDGEYVA